MSKPGLLGEQTQLGEIMGGQERRGVTLIQPPPLLNLFGGYPE